MDLREEKLKERLEHLDSIQREILFQRDSSDKKLREMSDILLNSLTIVKGSIDLLLNEDYKESDRKLLLNDVSTHTQKIENYLEELFETNENLYKSLLIGLTGCICSRGTEMEQINV